MAAKVKEALHKERCLACDGFGVLFSTSPNDPYHVAWACPICHGDGYVDPDENMTLERFDAIRKQAREEARYDHL